MSITLAAAPNSQLRHGGIKIAQLVHLRPHLTPDAPRLTVRVPALPLQPPHHTRRHQPIEHNLYVSGRHPVLQHRARVKLTERGSTLQRAEADAIRIERRRPQVLVSADGLLLIGLRDLRLQLTTKHLLSHIFFIVNIYLAFSSIVLAFIYVPTKHGICTIMEFFPPII